MKTFCLTLGCLLLLPSLAAGADKKEVLLGVTTDIDAEQVTFQVVSTGCTAKGDFRVEVLDQTLTLYRLRRDDCKAMPDKAQISFSLEELGLSPHKPFVLGNPIIVNVNLATL